MLLPRLVGMIERAWHGERLDGHLLARGRRAVEGIGVVRHEHGGAVDRHAERVADSRRGGRVRSAPWPPRRRGQTPGLSTANGVAQVWPPSTL